MAIVQKIATVSPANKDKRPDWYDERHSKDTKKKR
jgi:hypothetical protein